MKTFDLISDIHVDFWVNVKNNPHKYKKNMELFVQSLVPENHSDVLIIAGDLGHYNWQNMDLLTLLKQYYKYIFLVAGNHDFYLSNNGKKKYKRSSFNRFEEIKNWCMEQEGIHVLDGDVFSVHGLNIGGCSMWYDFSYGYKVLNLNEQQIRFVYRQESNDSRYIYGIGSSFFESQSQKFEKVLKESDILVTHVPADWSNLSEEHKSDATTSFYFFDIEPYQDKLQNKIWCSGHIHENHDYMNYGCRFVNAALGYPSDNQYKVKPIQTIVIGS